MPHVSLFPFFLSPSSTGTNFNSPFTMKFEIIFVSLVFVAIAVLTPQDVNSVLATLEENSPEDTAAAKSGVNKRHALKLTSPDGATAAKSGLNNRQDDMEAILAALETRLPEDAAVAIDLAGKLSALEAKSPNDAAAAKGA